MMQGCSGCSRQGRMRKAQERQQMNTEVSQPYEQTIESPTKLPNSKSTETPAKPAIVTPSLTELFKSNKPAVFVIYAPKQESTSMGSGFFIDPSGIAVTNYHVMKGGFMGKETIKLPNGEQLKIEEVIAKSEELDYFIFKVNSSSTQPFLPVASSLPDVGEEVFAIGHPNGHEHTLSKGIVSAFRYDEALIQNTAEITHGSSGGPLFNMKGEVIGITTGGDGEANINFSVNLLNVIQDAGLSNQIARSKEGIAHEKTFYKIKKFVDGDTFWIDDGSEKGVKIRLIGVNAPESRKVFNKDKEFFGVEAKNYVYELLNGKRVRLEYDIDKFDQFGRTLAYVYLEDGTFLNALLVKEGYAQVATYPPNVKHTELFQKLQREARNNQRGLWKYE